MRRAASVLLATCGLLLLLTWHRDGYTYWFWNPSVRFRLATIDDLDFVLKVAGVALLAAALLSWPKRRA